MAWRMKYGTLEYVEDMDNPIVNRYRYKGWEMASVVLYYNKPIFGIPNYVAATTMDVVASKNGVVEHASSLSRMKERIRSLEGKVLS